MSRLEEVSSKRLVLIDSFDARKNHVLMFAFSLLLGLVYGAYLWFVCSTTPGVLSGLLLFGSQIAMGFSATRAYYDLGVSNRENLHFIDPAKFNGNGEHHEVDIHLSEIPLIFEKIDIQIQKYDKGSLDDLSDLVWFGIFVWATYSSASFYLELSDFHLYIVGTLILLVACLGSYLSGYWTKRNFGFEDDLSHLQYYVEKHFKEIDSHLPDDGFRIYVQVLERWRSMVLVNFSAQIKLGDHSTVEYHLGFPSTEPEHIVVKAETELLTKVYKGLVNAPVALENGWKTTLTNTSSGSTILVVNESSDFSVNKRSSFVTSPSIIEDSSKITAASFSKVLSLVSKGRLS